MNTFARCNVIKTKYGKHGMPLILSRFHRCPPHYRHLRNVRVCNSVCPTQCIQGLLVDASLTFHLVDSNGNNRQLNHNIQCALTLKVLNF